MCCYIETKDKKILIDPGIALGYTRHGLLPHPIQVAAGEAIKKNIIKKFSEATDIILSHLHGDHVPLENANPYQLDIKEITGLNSKVKVWTKNYENLSRVEVKRRDTITKFFKIDPVEAEGKKYNILNFSNAVPHGEENSQVTVMMTAVSEDLIFVHASDIQLLNDISVNKIIDWKPDIAFVGGPPIYLKGKIPGKLIDRALLNALKLSEKINTLIIDHHLMRSIEGKKWLEDLSAISQNKILCGANFMKKPLMLFEANRDKLYNDMPVPENWHDVYTRYYYD
jgi:predicted metallo-beta-lactamase superfamily hydrolase